MNEVDISLYGILDPARCSGRPLPDLARAAVRGGATLLQYRDKVNGSEFQANAIREIIVAISGSTVPLLVNDDPLLAQASGAAGVHLGQEDMNPAEARQLLGDDAIIGLTVKTLEHARSVPDGVIDYVCIGGVHDTLSKDNPASIGVDGWRELAATVREHHPALPIGAIAGIDAKNLAPLVRAGADGVAIISAVFTADDVEAATRRIAAAIAAARTGT